jgi:hypothetical protein
MIEAKIEALTTAIERLTAIIERTVVAPDLSTKVADVQKPSRAPKPVKAAEVVEINTDTETASPIYTAPAKVSEINPATAAPALPDRKTLEKQCMEMAKKDRKLYDVIKALIAAHSDGRERLHDVPDSKLQAFADALEAL